MKRQQAHLLLDVLFDLGQKVGAGLVPPEAKQHFRAARKEALLGARALLDAAIARDEALVAEPDPGPDRIPVE